MCLQKAYKFISCFPRGCTHQTIHFQVYFLFLLASFSPLKYEQSSYQFTSFFFLIISPTSHSFSYHFKPLSGSQVRLILSFKPLKSNCLLNLCGCSEGIFKYSCSKTSPFIVPIINNNVLYTYLLEGRSCVLTTIK